MKSNFTPCSLFPRLHPTPSVPTRDSKSLLASSGGVAANSRLREELVKKGEENNIRMYIPSLYLCMDNAAMVGCLGYFKYLRDLVDDLRVDVSSKSDF